LAHNAEPQTIRRPVIAAGIGNMLEWYDFGVYVYLATVIGSLFFPSDDPTASLLASFAVFGVGFFMRPLGGFVFGHFGDKVGRRNALAAAIILMSGATVMIGVLPTHQQIGLLAPILLLVARLLQGLSAGGEWGGSATFIVEYAPAWRRGFYGSWHAVSLGSGILLGSGTAALLTSVLSEDALNSWGWRIPFLLGILLGIVGLYLRLKLQDTPVFRALEEAHEVEGAPVATSLRHTWKQILFTIGFILLPTTASYTFLTYMPTYLSEQLDFSLSTALLINTTALALNVVLTPFLGALSDRVGRKPLLIALALGCGLLTYPLFLLISQGGLWRVIIAQLILASILAFYSGPAAATLVELFPAKVRYTSLAVSHSISVAAFGGSAPFIATFLIAQTNNDLAPSFFVTIAAVITFVVILGMKETYRVPLR
jgi:MFS transporter, MHS family, proline/betaine transporter